MRRLALVLAAVAVTSALPGITSADPCTGSGTATGGAIAIAVTCGAATGSPGGASPQDGGSSVAQPLYQAFRWASACSADPQPGGTLECPAARTCEVGEERRWQLWGQAMNGGWETLRTECFVGTPAEHAQEVTPTDAGSALQEVELPRLRLHVQPRGETLVNLDTVFHTDPVLVQARLTLLGQQVQLVATPVRYRWVYGDGSADLTDTAGAPYPDKTVVHRYARAGVTVHPRVEATYGARFRVNGGGWQDVAGTVTTIGPPTDLRIAEATPLLSGAQQ